MTAAASLDRTETPERRSTGHEPSTGAGSSAPPARTATADGPGPGEAAPLSAGQRLAKVASDLLVAAIDRLAGAAADKVDDVVAKFDDIKAQGGVGLNAMIAGGLAKLQGQNPVWAAIKGAVGAMSTSTKVWVGLLLILTAVLAPVVLLVLAILLIVLAIAGAFSGGS